MSTFRVAFQLSELTHRPAPVKFLKGEPRRAFAGAAFALIVALSSQGRAQVTPPGEPQTAPNATKPPGEKGTRDEGTAALADVVELKNGALLRGLILEVDPAHHLSIRLHNGEVKQIPIGEVTYAERSGRAIALPGSDAPPTGEQPPVEAKPEKKQGSDAPQKPSEKAANKSKPAKQKPQASELDQLLEEIPGPRVELDVDANRAGHLQRQIRADGDLAAYHLVCPLPCRVTLPAEDPVPYRISGLRTEPTEWFQLPKYNSRVRADLVGSNWPLWPKGLLVGGVTFGLAGGTLVGAHALSAGADWVRDTGVVLAVSGGAFLLASGVVWLVRPTTSVSIERVE